jgi:hypothetical protein
MDGYKSLLHYGRLATRAKKRENRHGKRIALSEMIITCETTENSYITFCHTHTDVALHLHSLRQSLTLYRANERIVQQTLIICIVFIIYNYIYV